MNTTDSMPVERLSGHLNARFGAAPAVPDGLTGLATLAGLAGHAACRAYADRPVDAALIRLLCAVALSAPTKSDLQQADIVILADPGRRQAVTGLLGDDWIAAAPAFLVFCANNRRQRRLHQLRGHAFANDHLDAFFNATVDAAIVLANFVAAAEAIGLGCCPISAVRNHAASVSDLLGLPAHTFPVAGLALGWPARPGDISRRLPLHVTVHTDRYDEADLDAAIAAYDANRAARQPYASQRFAADLGEVADYGWSEDKARQYSRPERADFGAFIRGRGFNLA